MIYFQVHNGSRSRRAMILGPWEGSIDRGLARMDVTFKARGGLLLMDIPEELDIRWMQTILSSSAWLLMI